MAKRKVAVVDGKGGGLGRAMVEALRALPQEEYELIALGTNAQATRVMMAAGATDGATGENAVCYMAGQVDVILGPMAILVSNAMMGEITPKMAAAVSSSPAKKLLLPMDRCGVRVIGAGDVPLKELLNRLPGELARLLEA